MINLVSLLPCKMAAHFSHVIHFMGSCPAIKPVYRQLIIKLIMIRRSGTWPIERATKTITFEDILCDLN